MEFFKSILFLLGVRRPPGPRPIALESSALSKLPPELVLHIVCFLPPDAAASFSLCCRPIYFTLGTQYFKALEENEQWDRHKFLTLLERELPNHVVCYYCKKLHAIEKAHRHVYSHRYYSPGVSGYLLCRVAYSELSARLFIHFDFSYTVLQMVMKLHRQGGDCSKLLNLLSYKTETRFRQDYVEQCTALAQIVAGSLLFREQRIFRIQPTQPVANLRDLEFVICRHIGFTTVEIFNRNWAIIPIAHWDETKDYQNREGIIQCEYCQTEFRIDFKSFGEYGNAMFVTRWLDLGEGRSPLDHKWESHVDGHKIGCWLPVKFDRGSICAAFEQKEHFRFEFDSLLTLQSKKKLFRKGPWWWEENT